MPHSHKSLQHWDHWLMTPLGRRLLEAEKNYLPHLLADAYGKHAMLVGAPNQAPLIQVNHMAHQMILGPLISNSHSLRSIESGLYELPITTSSVDLVLLPHTLEFTDNPHKLLSEACRIVKMEGLIIIFGFNPYSLWGLRKKLIQQRNASWAGHLLSSRMVKKWLTLADFELLKQDMLFFRPPFSLSASFHHRLRFIEWMGHLAWKPFGGVYVLMAQAKGIPLTPIRMHWKQQLSGVKATFTGPSMGFLQS